jgi:hypothetical protein
MLQVKMRMQTSTTTILLIFCLLACSSSSSTPIEGWYHYCGVPRLEASSDGLIDVVSEFCRVGEEEDGGQQRILDQATEQQQQPHPQQHDYSSSEYAFSLFQKGDGSETDPGGIPARYLQMKNHNREQAKAALQSTLSWRREHDIDTILVKPHPKYDVCKSVFPHYFCGRVGDVEHGNRVVLVTRPGLINLTRAFANNMDGNDLLFHYVYLNEYLWQVLEAPLPFAGANATRVEIIDLQGNILRFATRRDLLRFVRLFVITMDSHYPLRAHKTLLINAPPWFSTFYKLISPLMRESTKEKITILSKGKRQEEILRPLLANCDGASLNNSTAGTSTAEAAAASTTPLIPSQEEQQLREFVSSTRTSSSNWSWRSSLYV